MLCNNICPRCQFRITPGRHVCPTCGHSLAPKKDAKTVTPMEPPASPARSMTSAKSAPVPAPKAAQTQQQKGFWKSLFSAADEPTVNDQRHDEPALGET